MQEDILARLQERQFEAAFDLLLQEFRDKIFRLAFGMMQNQTQAEDVTQDVLVKIWKALPAYRGGASLSTWVYAIARNCCLTELKRRASHPTISLQHPAIEAAADQIESLRWADPPAGAEMDVEALLAQLPQKYRQVLVLFYLEQKSYEEVALMLGIPLGTVKTLLFRAKKQMLQLHSSAPQSEAAERPRPPGTDPAGAATAKTALAIASQILTHWVLR